MSASPEKPAFDIDGALNDAKFAKFMAENPANESLDMADVDAVKQVYDTYVAKEESAETVKTLLGTMFESETGTKLTRDQLKSVEVAMSKKAIDDPEALIKLGEVVREQKEAAAAVEQAENEFSGAKARAEKAIAALTGKAEYTEKAAGQLSFMGSVRHFAKGIVGIFHKDDSIMSEFHKRQAERLVMKKEFKGIKVDDLVLEAARLRKEAADTAASTEVQEEALNKAVENFVAHAEEVKRSALESVASADEFKGVMKEAIDKRVTEAFRSGDLGKLDKIDADFGKFTESGEFLGQELYNEADREKYKINFDKQISQAADGAIRAALNKISLNNGALAKFEENIVKISSRERIGSNEDPKEFVLQILEAEAGSYTGPKKLFINRMIAKLKA